MSSTATTTAGTRQGKTDLSRRSPDRVSRIGTKTDLPPKNRVGGFSSYSETRARFFELQPVESHRETEPTPTTTVSGAHYYGFRFYSPEMGRWISRDPMEEFGGFNLSGFAYNDSVGRVDPLGLDVYIVYREFNDELLRKAYNDAGAVGVGHYYLVFDDRNVDATAWGKLVEQLGGQKECNPIFRNPNSAYESFSFHPREVLEEQLKVKEHPDSVAGTLYTKRSFVGYNDFDADIRPFLKQRDKGTNKDAAEARLFKLDTTQSQQFNLYCKVQELRVKINVNNEDVCGTYKLLINNCGTWAVNMVESQGITVPEGVRKGNMGGAGVGGIQDSLPITLGITAAAAVYGEMVVGVRNVKEDVQSTKREVNRQLQIMNDPWTWLDTFSGRY